MNNVQAQFRSNPLVGIAAVSVVVASITAAGFFTGLIPGARGQADGPAPLATTPTAAATTNRPATRVATPAAAGKASQPPVAVNANLGRVESVVPVEIKGQASGVGAVAGGVGGALLGSTMGQGNGKTAMTVLGAAGGALAGNEVEKTMKKEVRYDVAVRMDDGSRRTIRLATPPDYRAGDRVRVDNNRIQPAA